jgi:hypothetical protein
MNTHSSHQHHEMHLQERYPSGAEEWVCPTCGRRLLIQWLPTEDAGMDYKKIVLEAGNEHAMHSSRIDGLSMSSLEFHAAEDEGPPEGWGSPEEWGLLEACDVLPDALRAALEEALGEDDLSLWGEADESGA